MKANFNPIVFLDPDYIDLSEKLRSELELKIERLYEQNRLGLYPGHKAARWGIAAKNDFLYAYLLSMAPQEYVPSGKFLQGIKTWFNMYDDDRLSVIDKFRTYYQNVAPLGNFTDRAAVTIAFCKFLISELLCILAESRWQGLVHHAD
jgi:hypothetical protein